jgi:hypothetical protein
MCELGSETNFFGFFFCFCRFNKEKARKEIVPSPQKGKNWTIDTEKIFAFMSGRGKERERERERERGEREGEREREREREREE